jgi:hypothetical protein
MNVAAHQLVGLAIGASFQFHRIGRHAGGREGGSF